MEITSHNMDIVLLQECTQKGKSSKNDQVLHN